jgi:hypothetical protein
VALAGKIDCIAVRHDGSFKVSEAKSQVLESRLRVETQGRIGYGRKKINLWRIKHYVSMRGLDGWISSKTF